MRDTAGEMQVGRGARGCGKRDLKVAQLAQGRQGTRRGKGKGCGEARGGRLSERTSRRRELLSDATQGGREEIDG